MNFIFAIMGSAILLYCLWGKETRGIAIALSFILVLLVFAPKVTPEYYDDPSNFSMKELRMMELRGESLQSLKERAIEMQNRTPLESGAVYAISIASMLLFSLALLRDYKIEAIKRRCLIFGVCLVYYLMSLYLGLSIQVVAAPLKSIPKLKGALKTKKVVV
ncbi:MAG: hypothetical protein R3Y43_07145 [Alphaproteobacteria bacterium]